MFDVTADWWEIIIRVSLVYVFLLVLVRLSGKRQLGQITPMDLLTILLVSETVSPALTADDNSLPIAAVAAATLFALSLIAAVVTYKWRIVERVIEGTPTILIQDGHVRGEVMRNERITAQELGVAMRRNGIDGVSKVAIATVEPDGEITFIKA